MRPINSPDCPIWIVCDFPSRLEAKEKALKFGGGRHELLKTLQNTGFNSFDCFVTTISETFPYGGNDDVYFTTKTQAAKKKFEYFEGSYVDPTLVQDITLFRKLVTQHKPKLIITTGNIALFALTGERSASDWRGSELETPYGLVIPTYSIHTLVKRMDWSFIFSQDFRRANYVYTNGHKRRTEYFTIEPTFEEAVTCLQDLILRSKLEKRPLRLGVDIETSMRHITCIGIAWSPTRAICIPFTDARRDHYWLPEEELEIRGLLQELLTHPNVAVCGQNFNYDSGKIIHRLGFRPNVTEDTMIGWHVCYPGLPKSLGFIASMLLPQYVYWKDEGKGHCPTVDNQRGYWIYNCKDAARTLELIPLLHDLINSLNVWDQYREQMSLFFPVITIEARGVRQNLTLRAQYRMNLEHQMVLHEQWFQAITEALIGDYPLVKKVTKQTKPWYRSPTQLSKIFYEIFGLKHQWSRTNKAAKGPSVDDDALKAFAKEEPVLKILCDKLAEYRSMSVFLSTFVMARLEYDSRLRTSYGIGATETFRFTSGKYDFVYGANLQNIPKGNEVKD